MRRALVLLAVVLTAACGTRVRFVDAATPTPTSSASAVPTATASVEPTPTTAVSTDPLQLVRWWKLTYPAYGWSVSFGDEVTIVAPCGHLEADWRASPSGLFVAAEIGGDGSCLEKPPRPDITWYQRPRSFAVVGTELVLRGPDGAVTARLEPASAPPGEKASTLSAYRRAQLAAPAALPANVAPAALSSLQGKWVARGKDAGNGRGYVAFAVDWTWRGSDGCNGDGGSFTVGSGGDFLSTDGPHAAIGCDTTPAPSWVHGARRAGVQDAALVLYDVKGTLLGRLYRG